MPDVLFVCYGNICRSPMAEGLMDAHLREVFGPDHDLVVASAGVGATDGTRATREARDAMAGRGIDISAHRARQIDAPMARDAKWVFCMEPGQVEIVQSLAPGARVELLAGGVEDPIGCGAWVYEAVAHKIESAVSIIAADLAAERGIRARGPAPTGAAVAKRRGTKQSGKPVAAAAPAVAPVAEGARMRIALGSDHAGFRYKEMFREHLEKSGYDVQDFGCETELIPTDYTVVSAAIARAVAGGDADRGIIVAGSGNGEAIVANKVRGIRAAVCNDLYTAEMARRHNDANVLCVGQRACGEPVALKILDIWMQTPFEAGRHQARITNIAAIESEERGIPGTRGPSSPAP